MNALIFIIDALSTLYILILLVRLVLPFVRANFRNPVVQGIFKVTSPLVVPLRRLLPSIGRVDTATLVVALAIQYATLLAIAALQGFAPSLGGLVFASFLELLERLIHLFAYAIIVRIILSWLAPQQYNPVTEIVGAITEPLLAPARRVIPSIGGLDISPLFVTIALFALAILIRDLARLLL